MPELFGSIRPHAFQMQRKMSHHLRNFCAKTSVMFLRERFARFEAFLIADPLHGDGL
jgi:hypothetical protein